MNLQVHQKLVSSIAPLLLKLLLGVTVREPHTAVVFSLVILGLTLVMASPPALAIGSGHSAFNQYLLSVRHTPLVTIRWHFVTLTEHTVNALSAGAIYSLSNPSNRAVKTAPITQIRHQLQILTFILVLRH